MKAMILAAGLGTRLRPWTLTHPKALVPVEGVPMLERVIRKLKESGFDEIVINVHHFSDQIVDFIKQNDFGVQIQVSDESDMLRDTGGGILRASYLFDDDDVLIHNVDILSNAELRDLMKWHRRNGNDITLLTSSRDSSRKLLFSDNGELAGWHNLAKDQYRPESARELPCDEEAFSGIYIIGKRGLNALRKYAEKINAESFPIMEFFLSFPEGIKIGRMKVSNLVTLDIGKPETLARAEEYLDQIR